MYDSLYIHCIRLLQPTVPLKIRDARSRTPCTDARTNTYARSQPPPQIYINTWTARRGTRDLMDGWPDHSADCFAPDSDRKEIYNLSSLSARASERASGLAREPCASLPTYLPLLLVPLDQRSISEPRARSLVVLWTPARARRAPSEGGRGESGVGGGEGEKKRVPSPVDDSATRS